MPCCGPPYKPCQEKSPRNVRLRNGDLMMCDMCNEISFPRNVQPDIQVTQDNTAGQSNAVPNSAPNVESNANTNEPSSSESNVKIILNPLLSYIISGLNSGTAVNVKKAVLGHFTQEEIHDAKKTLFNECEDHKNIIGENLRRKSTSSRTEKEAHLWDILNALCQLDNQGKMPTIAIAATDLRKIPRSHPEELCNISLVDRLNVLEASVDDIKILLDRSLAENVAMREEIKTVKSVSPTYADIMSKKQPSVQVTDNRTSISTAASITNNVESAPVNDQHVPHSSRGNSLGARGRGMPRGGGQAVSRNSRNTLDIPITRDRSHSMERLSQTSDTRSGFQIPQYHKKKQKRFITGKKSISSVRGAPDPSRYLFIYRVHSDTTAAEMSAFMEEQSVIPRSLACVSHDEAKFKSFKLEVPKMTMINC